MGREKKTLTRKEREALIDKAIATIERGAKPSKVSKKRLTEKWSEEQEQDDINESHQTYLDGQPRFQERGSK